MPWCILGIYLVTPILSLESIGSTMVIYKLIPHEAPWDAQLSGDIRGALYDWGCLRIWVSNFFIWIIVLRIWGGMTNKGKSNTSHSSPICSLSLPKVLGRNWILKELYLLILETVDNNSGFVWAYYGFRSSKIFIVCNYWCA